MLRVLVSSDVRFYSEGLSAYLGREGRSTLVATATGAPEALRLARELSPDIVLLDLRMAHAVEVLRVLGRVNPGVRVVALVAGEQKPPLPSLGGVTVASLVTADRSLADLGSAVEQASNGHRVAPRAGGETPPGAPAARRTDWDLTPREREILALLELGLSNKEIAARLAISLSTVKNHVHHILEKLQARRRGEAAAFARARSVELI